jgi:hypothetical protein
MRGDLRIAHSRFTFKENCDMAKRRKRSSEDAADQEVVRHNYLLKNGTTISADDYDEYNEDDPNRPKIVEETDEEYLRRLASAPSGRPGTPMHPRTTIANLHTYDSTQVQTPPTPVPVPTVGGIIDSKPVMTSDEPNTNLLDPNNRLPSGAMRPPEVHDPNEVSDEDTDDDTDDSDKE